MPLPSNSLHPGRSTSAANTHREYDRPCAIDRSGSRPTSNFRASIFSTGVPKLPRGFYISQTFFKMAKHFGSSASRSSRIVIYRIKDPVELAAQVTFLLYQQNAQIKLPCPHECEMPAGPPPTIATSQAASNSIVLRDFVIKCAVFVTSTVSCCSLAIASTNKPL